jgi:aminoglycoside 2''-phosphotransferase
MGKRLTVDWAAVRPVDLPGVDLAEEVVQMGDSLDQFRAAIEESFPTLTVDTLEYLSEGWESVACLANGHLVFRFAKRAVSEHSLRTEVRLLPALAPQLPIPIPRFDYVGDPPGRHVPFVFVGYEMLPGTSALRWPDEVWDADWWKPQVGAFLTALHAFPVERARELGIGTLNYTFKLGGNTAEPADWRQTIGDYYDLSRTVAGPLLPTAARHTLTARFEHYLAEERHFAFTPVLIHADMAEDHMLIDIPRRRVTGIIDFGDVGIGDPAFDVFPPVLPHYGGTVDETFLARRAFYRTLFPPLNALLFGRIHGEEHLAEEGLQDLLVALDGEAS